MFADIYLRLPRPSPVIRNFLSTLLWRRWRCWTFPAQTLFSRGESGPDSPQAPYRKETMANLNAAVAVSLLQTLGENIAARRARVRAYQELLGADKRLELIAHRSGSACLTQVVRLLPQGRADDPAARAIETLARAGYEVQGSYIPIHLLPSYETFVRSPLPYAERVWADLVELPSEPEVCFDDVERIAGIVTQVSSS